MVHQYVVAPGINPDDVIKDDRRYIQLAIEDARKAMSMDPERSTNLARLLIEAGDYAAAYAILDDRVMNEG